jgi:nitrate reductase NapE component
MLFWFHFYFLLLFTTLKGLVQHVLHDVRSHFKSFDVLTIVVGRVHAIEMVGKYDSKVFMSLIMANCIMVIKFKKDS